MEKKKSLGVTVLGLFLILLSALSLIVLTLFPPMSKNPPLLTFYVIWAVGVFIAGIGIIRLKEWARKLALTFFTIKTIQLVASSIKDINILIKKSSSFGVIIVGIVLSVVFVIVLIGIIIYLTRPKVKEQFR